LNLGVYGSYASNVFEIRGNEEYKLFSEGIRKIDVGGTVRLNFTQRLFNSVHLTTGINYSNGALNIFKGVDLIPSHFYKTFTSSIGASVGLQYHF
jgi:hypothetical protein